MRGRRGSSVRLRARTMWRSVGYSLHGYGRTARGGSGRVGRVSGRSDGTGCVGRLGPHVTVHRGPLRTTIDKSKIGQ